MGTLIAVILGILLTGVLVFAVVYRVAVPRSYSSVRRTSQEEHTGAGLDPATMMLMTGGFPHGGHHHTGHHGDSAGPGDCGCGDGGGGGGGCDGGGGSS
ncbi:MAG: hypothetical protein IT436_02215 [Phycisphaerales bacterium]|nr:hypothetical protein [Phycisphaerales bacterium]